jgi:hypothetical protein
MTFSFFKKQVYRLKAEGGQEKTGSSRATRRFILLIFSGFVRFVDVSVEHRKRDEECNTDQVFDPLDVLVIVNQRKHFFYLANR